MDLEAALLLYHLSRLFLFQCQVIRNEPTSALGTLYADKAITPVFAALVAARGIIVPMLHQHGDFPIPQVRPSPGVLFIRIEVIERENFGVASYT